MAMSKFENQLFNVAMPGGLAGLGGLGMGLLGGGGLFGKPEQVQQVQRFNPQQQTAMGGLLNQGMQNVDFDKIRQQEINRFNTETIPSLAERFTSMGGGQRSSGFQSALGRAGSGLGQNLAGMQSQFGMQQLGMGLTPQFENVFRPAQKGALQEGISSIMQLLPMLAMFL